MPFDICDYNFIYGLWIILQMMSTMYNAKKAHVLGYAKGVYFMLFSWFYFGKNGPDAANISLQFFDGMIPLSIRKAG